VECLVRGQNVLGECTLWCEREQALWWIDSRGPALYRHDLSLSETRRLALPETIAG
jgi:L-arabinonolactonase